MARRSTTGRSPRGSSAPGAPPAGAPDGASIPVLPGVLEPADRRPRERPAPPRQAVGRLAPADQRAVRERERQRARADQHRQPLLRRRSGQPEYLPDQHLRLPDAARPRPPTSSPTATRSAPTRSTVPTWRSTTASGCRSLATSELFFQAQVWNLFNQDAIADVNNIDITTRTRDGGTAALAAFNPFTTTPQQGRELGAWPELRAGAEQERLPGAASDPLLAWRAILTVGTC